ncbi:aminopeptidase O isoform X3 [Pleurodeles waltl]|uniref:aminopeptidase O isoform X3 n=1 Tax=Pleurodeles waltl TaxID=8319 RepID=UPI003709C2FC
MALTQDDLPLMANTSHMLVRHYNLKLDVSFESQSLIGSAVLFLEPGIHYQKSAWSPAVACSSQTIDTGIKNSLAGCPHATTEVDNALLTSQDCDFVVSKVELDSSDKNRDNCNNEPVCAICMAKHVHKAEDHGREEFVLVLDCCDLSVLSVEEVDVAAVPFIESLRRCQRRTDVSDQGHLGNEIVQELVSLPDHRWREQHDYYTQCSKAPSSGQLQFTTDMWSLQIKKTGSFTPMDFPHAIRIVYHTRPEGRSVMWTKDQSNRPCVYTIGSNINNRALFPCQEPPVAMSTWQATIRAPADLVVLMSGENAAKPELSQEGLCGWFYYVTMPMPASTFTIAVGSWAEVAADPQTRDPSASLTSLHPSDDFRSCKGNCDHMPYPCRLSSPAAEGQVVIPHRLYAPVCFLNRCRGSILPLIPQCLSAAHDTLGTHPFSRLDVLIVPSNFSSLGMASPHIIFLSQSVLSGKGNLCGTRMCHEIAHAWFGLAIGARDWTEEWLSEGFATHLEDAFWVKVQKLSHQEASDQCGLKALLRWRRLRDEVENSEGELQVLRPNRENTGEVTESGASMVKHGLNPEKNFMQVHYLKGYFLLRHIASKIGEETYFRVLKKFVRRFHGQLVLSQDFLHMLLENGQESEGFGQSVETIYQIWLDTAGIPKPLLEESLEWTENRLVQQVKAEASKWIRLLQRRSGRGGKRKKGGREGCFRQLLPDQLVLLLECLLEERTLCARSLQRLERVYGLREQDAEVRHRWCELVVKHKYTDAYGDIETFLRDDQWSPDFLMPLRNTTSRWRKKQVLLRPSLCRPRWRQGHPLNLSGSSNKSPDTLTMGHSRSEIIFAGAMGVYLYGELMVSEDAKQQELARRCFAAVQDDMDASSLRVVQEMLF